ncbi:MAG: DUF362 domain-containing protein [Bacteroidales bacterium]|jgi:uncharacterized protein (DUF362 family)|nr:DUF362 domain-containing protein [Bacteroidales bacterium]
MKRRSFIKRSAGAGLAAGAALALGSRAGLLASVPQSKPYDMVAVMGGSPEAMFDIGIQSLGGIGSYVRKGQKVVIKPNIGWDVTPERAGNTHPGLVKRIIEHCLRAGASDVYLFDNTCDDWVKCYKSSGIEKAAKDAGAKVVPGNSESYYQSVTIPDGKILKSAKVHELILECDVFINVPVLKHHSSAKMTATMKNMMGVVWDRRFWHVNNLHQCIADYTMYERKPSLHVVDCYNVMLKNGPRGVSVADLVEMKSMILTSDWVAADTAAARMMGLNPEQIDYIPMAQKLGAGTMNLESLNIHRIKM